MKKILTLLAITGALSLIALGAAADGKWGIEGSDRTAPRELSLHVNGSSLTGTLDGVAITHSGVEGNFFWFWVVTKGVTVQYKGQIVNGKIKLHQLTGNVDRQLVFARTQ
jgi:hypothetical protein